MAAKYPFFFTFYSFKGGVGRSMALLNVAYSLTALGRNVLMVDMDLEAPGISGFLLRNKELERGPRFGVLDLLEWARRFVDGNRTGKLSANEAPNIADYTINVRTDRLPVPKLGKLGQLHLMGAYLDLETNATRSYYERLNSLELATISGDQLADVSSTVRAAIQNAKMKSDLPEYYGIGPEPSQPYDYVLIDSRTGGTEIGGLCVGPLADRVVVFTGLNDQNVQGTKVFKEKVGIPRFMDFSENDLSEAARGKILFPRPETDFTEEKGAILVVSPLPAGELSLKEQRLREIESELGSIAARLSYHPQMALSETNFVRDHPDEYLAIEYRALRDRLMQSVVDDQSSLAEPVRTFLQSRGFRDKGPEFSPISLSPLEHHNLHSMMRATERKGPEYLVGKSPPQIDYDFAVSNTLRLASINLQLGLSLLYQLEFIGGLDRNKNFISLDRIYRALTRYGDPPTQCAMLYNWGITLLERRKHSRFLHEANRLSMEAIDKFKLALAEQPRSEDIKSNILASWASSLNWNANSSSATEAEASFDEAIQKLQSAITAVPSGGELYFARALVYRDRGSRTVWPYAEKYFHHAHSDFRKALQIGKGNDQLSGNVKGNWAITAGFQARAAIDLNLHTRFRRAYSLFRRIKPLSEEWRGYWANLLADEARVSSGERKVHLFREAYQKYSDSKPANQCIPEAVAGMVRILAETTAVDTHEPLQALMQLAEAMLSPGKNDGALAIQHMACAFARMGREDDCRRWLYRGRDAGNLEPRRLHYDPDFESFRSRNWFRDLLAQFSMIPR